MFPLLPCHLRRAKDYGCTHNDELDLVPIIGSGGIGNKGVGTYILIFDKYESSNGFPTNMILESKLLPS